jgi:hypothetical protein
VKRKKYLGNIEKGQDRREERDMTPVGFCGLRRLRTLRDGHECDKPSRQGAARSGEEVPAPHLSPAGENSSSRWTTTRQVPLVADVRVCMGSLQEGSSSKG